MKPLAPNTRVILAALNGTPARHTIAKHPGLYLLVRGEGRGSWAIRYRIEGKRNQRWYTITNDARGAEFSDVAKEASKLLADIKLRGIDPHGAEDALKISEDLSLNRCFRLWLDHTGKRRAKPLSPRSRKGYEDLFKLHIEPHLGKTRIASLDRIAIRAIVDRVKTATTDPKRNRRGLQATKVLKLLSSVCEWCVDREIIIRNPCRGIDFPTPINHPDGKQSRPPTNSELKQLWREAPRLMSEGQLRVLQLGILLGRRISEITGAMHEDVRLDLPIPCLVIPADRLGNKPKKEDAVPLPPLALSILKAALGDTKPGQPLFVGAMTRWTTSKMVTMLRKVWGWPDPPVRFHDFRGLINDQMAALGISTELRSRTLHHTGDLRQLANTVYSAYDFMPERLQALEQWEERLLQIVEATPALRAHRAPVLDLIEGGLPSLEAKFTE